VIIVAKWVKACNTSKVGQGELFGFVHGDKKILLANLNGKVYATDLICTHAEADLSTGMLSEEGVRCPLHLSVFDLNTGEPKSPPAEKPLKTYNVKTDNDEIYVEV
jgi:3-phenylpropionate/trans-cinnamate dioxygenase ferredoxin component